MLYWQKKQGEGIKYQIEDGTFRVHVSERMTLSREPMTGVGAIIPAAINKHKHPEVGTSLVHLNHSKEVNVTETE